MNKNWEEFFKPVVVLTVICLAISAALAATNSVTAGIIAENTAAAAAETRTALLPEADSFEQMTCTTPGVTDAYKAVNGAGYVITGAAKGYSDYVPAMVAFDANGNIVNVKILDNTETPGLGKKVENISYYGQFVGKEAKRLAFGTDVTAITGATISSAAVLNSVNNAIAGYIELTGGNAEAALTPDEIMQTLVPEGSTLTVLNKQEPGIRIIATCEGATVFVSDQAGYDGAPLTVYTAIDNSAAVMAVYVDASTQTAGLGTKVAEEAFISQFVGKADVSGITAVAGATVSSNAVIAGVEAAQQAFAAVKGE